MNTKELDALITVARSKSFYEAAYTLNYSSSVISKYVANVEKELGVVLFNRGNKSAFVSLTSEGAALMPHFMRMQECYREVQNEAAAFQRKSYGLLRIGTGYHISSLGMSEILAAFLSAHPEIRVEQTKLDFETQIHSLYSGTQDGVFTLVQNGSPNSSTLGSVINDPKVESFLLVREHDMYLGISEEYLPGNNGSAALAAFSEFSFVFHSDNEILTKAGTMAPFLTLSGQAGFELKPIFLDPRDTSVYYLATRMKIAIPSLRGSFKFPGIKFVRIEDWNSFSACYFLNLRANRNPALTQFKQSVREYMRRTVK